MKTLVIMAHPELNQSRINKRLAAEAEERANVTVHHLYTAYPDENIDVVHEQQLLEAHDRIVLQFPFYWYSSPSLLKKWQDTVLQYGWAYGTGGYKLHGKELIIAISSGGPQEAYQAGGPNHYTYSELLRPFQATANLLGMTFRRPFIVSGIRGISDEQLEEYASQYGNYIQGPPLD
ncbi:NAD(P)H-dependent oxidoreductase [Paenibacillus sp. BR2-3]